MPKSRTSARDRPLPLKRSPAKRVVAQKTSAQRAAAKKPAAGDGMRIMVRDLMLSAKIGLHQHERIAQQRIRVNLDLAIADLGVIDDDYDKVVCYGELVTGVRHVVGAGHVNLVETLAERIAAMCLRIGGC
jgi:Dihydroneopterin aldolase